MWSPILPYQPNYSTTIMKTRAGFILPLDFYFINSQGLIHNVNYTYKLMIALLFHKMRTFNNFSDFFFCQQEILEMSLHQNFHKTAFNLCIQGLEI